MTAKEACELATRNLKEVVIQPYLECIYEKIREAAEAGKMSITRPFYDLRLVWPSHDHASAIWKALEADGYKVEHHPDPDPGHPASSPYTEISWG